MGGTMGAYRTILADPPWKYGDKLRQSSTRRSSEDQYDVMTVAEICALGDTGVCRETMDIAGHLLEDEAFLWLWVTNCFLLDGSGAKVCKAWGFEPKQLVTWVKTKKAGWTGVADSITEGEPWKEIAIAELDRAMVSDEAMNEQGLQMGMGRITRGVTEHVIVATRGKYSRHVMAKNRRNVIFAPRREHSRKPDEQYELIESICPGQYLELFAREQRDGWASFGNELS